MRFPDKDEGKCRIFPICLLMVSVKVLQFDFPTPAPVDRANIHDMCYNVSAMSNCGRIFVYQQYIFVGDVSPI